MHLSWGQIIYINYLDFFPPWKMCLVSSINIFTYLSITIWINRYLFYTLWLWSNSTLFYCSNFSSFGSFLSWFLCPFDIPSHYGFFFFLLYFLALLYTPDSPCTFSVPVKESLFLLVKKDVRKQDLGLFLPRC